MSTAAIAVPQKNLSEEGLILSFLGLKPGQSTPRDLELEVEKGIKLRFAENFLKQYESLFAHSTARPAVSRSTILRAKKNHKARLSTETSERLYSLIKLMAHVNEVYGMDGAKVERFLQTPHALLEGRPPIDVALNTTAGADRVLDLINRGRAGVYA